MISIMCRSIGSRRPGLPSAIGGGIGGRIARTASTTSADSFLARLACSLVARDVWAIDIKFVRSRLGYCLKESRNYELEGLDASTVRDSFFAKSKPSPITRG